MKGRDTRDKMRGLRGKEEGEGDGDERGRAGTGLCAGDEISITSLSRLTNKTGPIGVNYHGDVCSLVITVKLLSTRQT